MKINFAFMAASMSGCLVGTHGFARPSSHVARTGSHSMVANPVDAPSKSQVRIGTKENQLNYE